MRSYESFTILRYASHDLPVELGLPSSTLALYGLIYSCYLTVWQGGGLPGVRVNVGLIWGNVLEIKNN